MTELGAAVAEEGTRFAVRSPDARGIDLCLFDQDVETRLPMERHGEVWTIVVPRDLRGSKYGFRADGSWSPESGLWFDSSKLLVDPYAKEIDRRFVQHPHLGTFGRDTAAIVPRAIVPAPSKDVLKRAPRFERGGLIYELNVRAFTLLHPDVPEHERGTIAALAHPALIAHFRKLHVSAIELMPIIAWIDERHLPPLGLVNCWGYNPIAFMALDPGLCPGGITELRETVKQLHRAGIDVILDVVMNHTGESDAAGAVLSLRGLDNSAYAHSPDGRLVNYTGCGNTLDFSKSAVRELVIDALEHFVRKCGIDGFRFDLAAVLARGPEFDSDAPIFAQINANPWLEDRILIAEPWDIGPAGYCLGQFPENWLEWNDRYRDDLRRFWRGDKEVGIGRLATRLAGSSDIFGDETRSVNFVAAHDGMTLLDVVSFNDRHNQGNGENNRDGHHENFSWNHGTEGTSDDPELNEARLRALKAMLATLFASAGSIMLCAGDEFGRSQLGNNNAYCQDNRTTWIDWERRDRSLEDYVADLASMRAQHILLFAKFPQDARWLGRDCMPMTVADWECPSARGFKVELSGEGPKFLVDVDRMQQRITLSKGSRQI